MTLFDVYMPVVKSVIATPTFTGGPSLEPVMCMSPNSLFEFQHILERLACWIDSRFHHDIVAGSMAVWSILTIASDARIDET